MTIWASQPSTNNASAPLPPQTWHERMRQGNTTQPLKKNLIHWLADLLATSYNTAQPLKKRKKKSHSLTSLAVVQSQSPKAQFTNVKDKEWNVTTIATNVKWVSSSLPLLLSLALRLCPSFPLSHFFSLSPLLLHFQIFIIIQF